MTASALIYEVESEMLANLVRLLTRGSIGSAEWQVRALQSLGLLEQINAATIKAHREEILAAAREEILSLAASRVKLVNDASSMAGAVADIPDRRTAAILTRWDAEVARKLDTVYATMLRSAGDRYVDTVKVATVKTALGMSGRKAVAEIVQGWADLGLPGFKDAAGREWTPEAYASTLVRSSSTQAATATQFARMDELGEDLVEVSSHLGARPKCAPYQGRIYSLSGKSSVYPPFSSTSYGDPGGLLGVNCVLGDTLVSGPAQNAVYRREYTGEIITIITANGNKLSVTPNHPILTDKGWVPAYLLTVGCNVISRSFLDGISYVGPDPDYREPTIEQVFNSFLHGGDIFLLPASACNFHGDIPNHDVDVVFKNGFLRGRGKPSICEHFEKGLLHDALKSSRPLLANSSPDKVDIRSFHSTDGIVSGGRNSSAPFFAASLVDTTHDSGFVGGDVDTNVGKVFAYSSFGYPDLGGNFILPKSRVVHGQKFSRSETCFPEKKSLPISSAIDPVTLKAIKDSLKGTSVFISDESSRDPGVIQLDNIVSIQVESTKGTFVHVYNLQTESGWYYSNNIISHNCRHVIYPYFPGTEKTFNPYPEERNDAAYKRSQEQRSIERSIRGAKRELDLAQKVGDEATIAAAKSKVSERQKVMRGFIDDTGRRRDYDREQIRG